MSTFCRTKLYFLILHKNIKEFHGNEYIEEFSDIFVNLTRLIEIYYALFIILLNNYRFRHEELQFKSEIQRLYG